MPYAASRRPNSMSLRFRFRVRVRVGVKVGVGVRARFRADLCVGHGVDPVGLAVADDVVPG